MFFTRLFATLAVLSVAAIATAESVTFSGSYDGSYDPYSATPPTGQDTWIHGTATITPTPNSPSAGLADFSDPIYGRLQMSRVFGAGTFSADQSDDIYTLTARIKLGSTGIANPWEDASSQFNLGFYNESNGTSYGKTALIGFIHSNPADGDQPGLWLAGSAVNDPENTNGAVKLSNTNYFDDEWHIYTLDKYRTQAGTMVRVLVDGVQVGSSVAYADLHAGPSWGQGAGYFGSTPCEHQATLDYLEYTVTTDAPVPEPSTIVSLAMLLAGLGVCAWRKRK